MVPRKPEGNRPWGEPLRPGQPLRRWEDKQGWTPAAPVAPSFLTPFAGPHAAKRGTNRAPQPTGHLHIAECLPTSVTCKHAFAAGRRWARNSSRNTFDDLVAFPPAPVQVDKPTLLRPALLVTRVVTQWRRSSLLLV